MGRGQCGTSSQLRHVTYFRFVAAAVSKQGHKGMTEKQKSSGVWPYLALVAGIICVSWSAIFVRWTDMPGSVSAFYRMVIPAIILLPTWLIDRKQPRISARTLGIIAIGGLFFAMDLGFYNTAILLEPRCHQEPEL